MKKLSPLITPAVALFFAATSGCTPSGQGQLPAHFYSNVTVSWAPNHEKRVNEAGGGYRVYYATQPGFAIGDARYVDVPYAPEKGLAPTTAKLGGLPPGKYYVKITAYAGSLSAGTTPESLSAPSDEVTVSVP